ncbi:6,7-dimethyl-8-ribityllumazine synthase [Piscinibacter aquaticus]|uniref:6,7-dimethyl-8-ribityllumazine synthase n=1 Tax=Piscinibacter aquaticus TaxID=392597 RepID=A0A5C6U483_9BURK|nr:6,7-dimethyl-8-ribityllumazine synthase [Piscinibacter aquaticus]
MNQTTKQFPSKHEAGTGCTSRARVAVISSSWHRDIVANATTAIRAELSGTSDPPGELDHFEVPGAFEIPLHAKRLAASGAYDAIIACGLVVNGGIYRHEFVASAVIDGLMRVQLETDTPVFSAVLTPRDFHEHAEHRKFFSEHFIKKGKEAAQACVQTLASLSKLPSRDG